MIAEDGQVLAGWPVCVVDRRRDLRRVLPFEDLSECHSRGKTDSQASGQKTATDAVET
jgi:hypothetical protein